MRKLQIGDKCIPKAGREYVCSDFQGRYQKDSGRFIMLAEIQSSGSCRYAQYESDGTKITTCGCYSVSDLQLLSSETSTSIMGNITEKFLLAITKEPQRSFRKAGITNGDDLLTDEGTAVFLAWLLSKNQDDFKKEVVDGLLEDEKKK